MCGIVGAIAQRDVAAILLEGLKRLEYRGYDSAGLAIIDDKGALNSLRRLGKVRCLQQAHEKEPLMGRMGVAHTRWATHGQPSECNAHPHTSSDDLALVHNGIIENHAQLKESLREQGYCFESQTDTEVAAHLVHSFLREGNDLVDALRLAAQSMTGAFAIAVINKNHPDSLAVVRQGSPLVLGLGIGENFVASDPQALQGFTQELIYLEDGDVAKVTCGEFTIFDAQGTPVERPHHPPIAATEAIDKGPYRHFMLKEIYQQPEVIAETLQDRLSGQNVLIEAFGDKAPEIFSKVKQVHIVACGTSYHAGLIARYWIETFTAKPCQVEVASEYRYRQVVVPENTLFVTLSQSGETADTLAALEKAKSLDYLSSLAICNVANSTLVRESELVMMTRAGVEVGVASTKAFTTQLVVLLMLAVGLSKRKMNADTRQSVVQELMNLPQLCEQLLHLDPIIEELSEQFVDKHHALFLGRGVQYPVALEGALKLKEISYIHAEAYPAGELKHGPLALVDKDMPVIAVAPNDDLLDKLKSNLQEVRARGGELYVFADNASDLKAEEGVRVIGLPQISPYIAPIAYTIPLQLLAYHVAVLKGTDVDQPRNLAKSVTVE